MGFPIDRLILATNENDILARFFETGVYERGVVHHTISPAMDIQVASNFERFLFYHFDQDADLRENNVGFGAEVELRRNHLLTAGTFLNSDDDRSRYAGYEWRPLHWQPAKLDLSAGLIVAALDGYPRVRNGGWFVAVLPVVSVQWKRIGFNLTAVPTIKDRFYGAVAIQFKLRIW